MFLLERRRVFRFVLFLNHVLYVATCDTNNRSRNISSADEHRSFLLFFSPHPQRTVSVRTSLDVRPLCHSEPVPRGYKCTVSSTEHIQEASCHTYVHQGCSRPLWDDCLGPQMWWYVKDFISSRPHEAPTRGVCEARTPVVQMDHGRIFINNCTAKKSPITLFKGFMYRCLCR